MRGARRPPPSPSPKNRLRGRSPRSNAADSAPGFHGPGVRVFGARGGSAGERRPDGEREAREGQRDQSGAEELVERRLVAVLGEGETEPREEAACESAGVGPVVHARHEEAHDEEDQRPLPVLLQDHAPVDTPALPTVGDDRPEEAEDRAGRTDRERHPEGVRDDEAGGARDREDDDEPSGPPNPHMPGLRRPHTRHTGASAFVRRPQEGQRIAPEVLRNIVAILGGDPVSLVEPYAEVDEPAGERTERAIRIALPGGLGSAGRARHAALPRPTSDGLVVHRGCIVLAADKACQLAPLSSRVGGFALTALDASRRVSSATSYPEGVSVWIGRASGAVAP